MDEWSRQLGPRTRMGLVSSISNNQALVAAIGFTCTYVVLSEWQSVFALPTGIVLALLTASATLVHRWGMPVADWVLKSLAYKTGKKYWHARPVGVDAEQLPRELRDAQIVTIRGSHGELVGMVRDGRALIAVAKLELHSLGLFDSAEQGRRLNSRQRILDDLSRSATVNDPEYRVQLLSRHTPRRANGAREYLQANMVAEHAQSRQAQSMMEVVERSERSSHDDEFYVAIRASAPRKNSEQAAARLMERMRLLQERLERAEIAVRSKRRLLEPRDLARVIKDQFDPFGKVVRDELERVSGLPGTDPRQAWPDWRREHVDFYETDGAMHCTLWIRGWPPVEVEPGWLKPLTLRCEVPAMSVSTVLATESKGKAKERARRKRSRTASVAKVSQEHGQEQRLEHSERDAYLLRQEQEMQRGASPWCWEMYVTVSAPDREQLEESVRRAESACTECDLTPVRVRWGQKDTFCFTLPLGRGLEPEKGRL